MKILFVLLIAAFYSYCAVGQNQAPDTKEEAKPKFTVGFDGQFAVTTNGKFSFVNFGGPGLRVNMKPFVVSLNMLPSLSFYEGNPARPAITPNLGVGVFK